MYVPSCSGTILKYNQPVGQWGSTSFVTSAGCSGIVHNTVVSTSGYTFNPKNNYNGYSFSNFILDEVRPHRVQFRVWDEVAKRPERRRRSMLVLSKFSVVKADAEYQTISFAETSVDGLEYPIFKVVLQPTFFESYIRYICI